MSAALSDALGGPVTAVEPVGGGCINESVLVSVGGRRYFVKWHPNGPADLFEREALGLRAMAQAVASSGAELVIPEVIAVGRRPGFLVLEHLPLAPRRHGFDERLGAGLAAMHRAPHQQCSGHYGFSADTYCGTTLQVNVWQSCWSDLYREQRLAPLIEGAGQQGHLSVADGQVLRRVLDRLPELLAADPEPPALIHGDLWSGNLHTGPEGGPALIDPAAYYAHREAELGMMVLFGGFSQRVFQAYAASWPLSAGWQERLPLYTLYHVLNHCVLFGGSYGAQAVSIARRYL
ncbi:MAG: fructosamine kinase family protein [Bradymonadia bacterium]